MSEQIWSDDAWEDYLYWQTGSSTIWKTGGSTSPTAEATMEINKPNQSLPISDMEI